MAQGSYQIPDKILTFKLILTPQPLIITSQQILSVYHTPPPTYQDIASRDEELGKIQEMQSSLLSFQSPPSLDDSPKDNEPSEPLIEGKI